MSHPLYVAFVWHQHQPDYRDPFGRPACLPWVRLHAAKDYIHMAELVADFPAIHCTFNFVPSLVDQLAGIGAGRSVDEWQVLSLKERWSADEQQFLRDHFFSIHPRLLERYPGYVRLRDRRDAPDWTRQEFTDLVAWFNLAWIDPRAIRRDETLRALVAKGEGFSRMDIVAILAKHREFAARVIPIHRDLAARGQIELSVSPYYHPILPLLADQRSAREGIPNLILPPVPFAHPEDAAEQVRRAKQAHRDFFGTEPAGLWPSEGSVSDAVLGVVGNEFRWLASDEDVLARSLGTWIGRDQEGHVTNPRVLYQPYQLARDRTKPATRTPSIALIFRDHVISDRIGFAFQYMAPRDAAQELIYRLQRIRERIVDTEHGYLVSIILDGENAWESYEDNGDPFFRELYGAISNDPWLRTVTVSEYLHENPPRGYVKRLAAGSWINGNFDTWIGEPAQNRAWELLGQSREALMLWQHNYALADESVLARAWDEVYTAEGSDWFWWYSSHNNSAQNAMFDELFRGHLQNVYATIGLPIPVELKEPIRKMGLAEQERGITTFITPSLTSAETAGEEWNGAGTFLPFAASTGTMQHAENKLARVLYGYGAEELFFRVESRVDLAPYRVALYLATPAVRVNLRPRFSDVDSGSALNWEIALDPGQAPQVYAAQGQEIWRPVVFGAGLRVSRQNRTVEIAVSRRSLQLEWGNTVGLLVTLAQDRQLVEALPAQGLVLYTMNNMTS